MAWNLRPAPKPKRHPMLRTPKLKVCDEVCSLAWRAGAIGDWRFGQRSDTDATLVWFIDGVEYAKDATDDVQASVRRRLDARGIAEIRYGGQWCGYREVVVTYASGETVTERYDGNRVVIDQGVAA